MPAKTIFALATPPGKSGVCVIRISGPETADVIQALTQVPLPQPRQAVLRSFRDPATGQLVDEGLLLWFQGPHSFTGEDSAEFQLHGSVAVIAYMTRVLLTLPGMRLAEPGEFSKRAFHHGKMDLTQAEGLADLIDAETAMQHRQALRQSTGELGALYESWRAQLLQILGYLEAYIDFPDEDLPDWLVKQVEEQKITLLNMLRQYLADARRGERLRAGLYAVIFGAPNVGKSSLLNAIARRDVAIVSQHAGTTRDVLEVHLDIGGYPITLADTAGLRETEEAIEKEGIRRTRLYAERADMRIAMFDATLPLDPETLALLQPGTLVVWNKIDQSGQKDVPDLLQSYTVIPISVATQQGFEQLLIALEEQAALQLAPATHPAITRERYRALLTECAAHLARCDIGQDIVLAAEDLRLAARALANITGKLDAEDILDYIFQNFCIGK